MIENCSAAPRTDIYHRIYHRKAVHPKINLDDRFCLICLHVDRGGSQMTRLHMQKIMTCKL